MEGFVDEIRLEVYSGKGGAGCVSFRREKYVPRGGPDGGDGGRGGDVVFQIKRNLKTLSHLRGRKVYRAQSGQPGQGKRMHGKNGEAVLLPVPPGTLVRDGESGEVLKDFADAPEGTQWVFLRGGEGGRGNWHFRSSRKQAPRYAQEGLPGEAAEVLVELNLIADIGFVGFPSVGKSSLLKTLTKANPKVASYPFTTKIPHLGMLRVGNRDIVLADIPGILKGASEGVGLGFRFLKHITRTAALAFLVDMGEDGASERYAQLQEELGAYSPTLLEKPRILIATKMDLEGAPERLALFLEEQPQEGVIPLSVFSHQGLEELKEHLLRMVR